VRKTWIDLSGDSVCWSYAEISLVLGDAYSCTVLVSDIWFAMCYDGWLRFMWGVAKTKCILVMHVCVSVICNITFRMRQSSGEMYCVLVTCVCVSVPHGISTLLHGPGCNLGEWQGVPSSYAVLCKFAIGARALLLWQLSAEHEMLASAYTRSVPGCHCRNKLYMRGKDSKWKRFTTQTIRIA